MKITIKGTNLELNDSLYQYIYDKIGGLEKFIENIGDEAQRGLPRVESRGNPSVECWVEVGRTTKHHQSGNIFRAEIQIRLPGSEGVRTESTQWDLHRAIDEAKDEMQRRLKRYKRKQSAK